MAYLGFERIDSSAQNPSAQNITVPGNCNCILVGYANWSGSGDINFTSLTVAGVSGSAVVEIAGNTTHMEAGIWVVVNPATGAQTAQWTQNLAPGEGTRVWLIYLSDVDTSNPIRDSDSGFNTNGDPIGLTVDSTADDFVFGVMSSFSAAVDMEAGANQTAIEEPSTAFNTCYGGVGYHAAPGASTTTFTADAAASDDPGLCVCSVRVLTADLDQEGFRWGVDDGNESAHGWEAAQDTNITLPDNQSRLLRCLVDVASGDPGATAYTLRVQKNGSGGYAAVPVGATTTTSPPAAPSATVTTIGTATDPWTINRPAASTGDMIVFVIAWDDSTAVTSVTAPGGVNSESAVSIAGPIASNSTEMRQQAWYYIATGAWSTGTLSFDPSASETCRAVAFVIPAGQFNASDPIGFANTLASAGTAESNVDSPTGTAEGDDGDGRLYISFGSDADALTAPGSNWNTINNATGGGVGLLVGSRNALVTNSESIAALTATIASDSWASLCFVVKPNVANNECYVTTSANIAAGGEATTARLTAPSGKTTSDFVTGRRWDDENGTDTIDITTDDYTEVEWLIALSSTPINDDYFEFRVYAGASALGTYTLTPRWTVGTAVTARPYQPQIALSSVHRASNF